MFEPTSRYFELETAELTVLDADGEPRVLRYVRRRVLPPATPGANPISHVVREGERLDHLAARHYGDPTQFWRICDANRVLRPDELLDEPGRAVDIPLLGEL